MKASVGVIAVLLLCVVSAPAKADCYACGFVGTDPACVKKSSGYTNCGSSADQSGKRCQTEGTSCGGSGRQPESPVAFNDCQPRRLYLVRAEVGNRPEPRLRLVAVQ